MDYSTILILDTLGVDKTLVEDVSAEPTDSAIVVRMAVKRRASCCPQCGSTSFWAHETRERDVKCSGLIEKPISVRLKVPVYRCRGCGRKFREASPLSSPRARTGGKTISLLLDHLSCWNSTFASAARLLHISQTAAVDLFDRSYDPARGRLPKVLCIDECYDGDQFEKPYCLNLFDWSDGRLVDILEGREKRRISSYLFSIPKEERDAVEWVCIDMWESYLDLAKSYFKNAKVVVDSFHVMQNLCRAVNAVRCRVMNSFEKGSDAYHYLKQYHWAVFKNGLKPYAKKRKDGYTKRWLNAWEAREIIKSSHPDLREAIAIYDDYQTFNSKPRDGQWAKEKIEKILARIDGSGIAELQTFATTVRNWKKYILASFEAHIGGRRVSNGPMEGFNSQFKKLMRVANGFANFKRFRARAFLCYNKDMTLNASAKPRKRRGKKRGRYAKKGKGDALAVD